VAGRWRRRGFATQQLLAALGLAFLIGLLLLGQSGSLGLSLARVAVGKPQPAAGQGAKGGKNTKGAKGAKGSPAPPPLYPSTTTPLQAALPQLAQRRTQLTRAADWRGARSRRALGHMDEAAAAAILVQLSDPQAVDLLRGLDEFALARVLEAAPPPKAAAWISALAAPAPPASLAPELTAGGAGSADERLTELLRQYGYGPDGAPLAAASANPPSAAPAGAPAGGPTQPPGSSAGAGSAGSGAGQVPPAVPGTSPI
jgi:hypothetical protein